MCKSRIAEEMDIDPKLIELSMGMSNDFEKAVKFSKSRNINFIGRIVKIQIHFKKILMGSSSVRIGSLIFGPRS